jgi:hypothetical protein
MEAARRAIEAAYSAAGRAWHARDAAALMRMVAPGFTQTMPDGRVISRDEAAEGLAAWFAATDAVKAYDVRIRDLKPVDEAFVATVEEKVTTTFADPSGGQHQRVQQNTAEMAWVLSGASWHIQRSRYVAATMTVDGKPVDPLTGLPV